MIRFTKGLVISHITQLLTPIKNYIDNKVSALASSVGEIMEDVNQSFAELEQSVSQKGNCDMIIIENKTVEKSSWTSDTTYTNYPYRAAITLSGITASHSADVVFFIRRCIERKFCTYLSNKC